MSLSFFDPIFLSDVFSTAFAGPASLPVSVLFLMSIAVVIINLFLLVAFGMTGAVFLKRMSISSGELEEQKRQAYEKAEGELESSRKESLRIVEEANKKAGELLQQTGVTKQAIETELTRLMQDFAQKETQRVGDVSTELIGAYKAMMDSTKQQYGSAMAATAKEMAGTAQQSLTLFEQFLKDQTTRYEGTLARQVQEGFMSAQKEISDYKRESLRKVEDAIYRIINLVTKSVLGKALSLEDKQDLVVHALDEAKKEGFFEL